MYQLEMSMSKIADIFGSSEYEIKNILEKNNIEIRKDRTARNLNFREDYFEHINSEYKAYFLGFLMADGCVSNRSNNRSPSIELKIKNEDSYILQELKRELNTENKVGIRNGKYSSLRVHSRKMALDLEKYSVVPNKTFTCAMPALDSDIMPHFIRGLIDGDGWISQKTSTKKYSIGLCNGSTLCHELKQYFYEILDIEGPKIKEKSNINSIEYQSQKEVFYIGEYIYKDANIFLKRKKEKFDKFLNEYK